jgi:non-homologous end joining protein Ku
MTRCASGPEGIGDGQFLLVEDGELEAIEIESTHTIENGRRIFRHGLP